MAEDTSSLPRDPRFTAMREAPYGHPNMLSRFLEDCARALDCVTDIGAVLGRIEQLRTALAQAPRPLTTRNGGEMVSWLVTYMDWYFKVRGPLVTAKADQLSDSLVETAKKIGATRMDGLEREVLIIPADKSEEFERACAGPHASNARLSELLHAKETWTDDRLDSVARVETVCERLRALNANYDVAEPPGLASPYSELSLFFFANRHFIADTLGAVVAENRRRAAEPSR